MRAERMGDRQAVQRAARPVAMASVATARKASGPKVPAHRLTGLKGTDLKVTGLKVIDPDATGRRVTVRIAVAGRLTATAVTTVAMSGPGSSVQARRPGRPRAGSTRPIRLPRFWR